MKTYCFSCFSCFSYIFSGTEACFLYRQIYVLLPFGKLYCTFKSFVPQHIVAKRMHLSSPRVHLCLEYCFILSVRKMTKIRKKNSICSCRHPAEEKLSYTTLIIVQSNSFGILFFMRKRMRLQEKLIASLPGCMKQIFEMKEKPFTSSLNIWGREREE